MNQYTEHTYDPNLGHKYDATLAYQDYVVNDLPWKEVSKKIWPGVPTKNTDKAKNFLDRKYKFNNNINATESTEDKVNFEESGDKRNYTIITHKQVTSLEELIDLVKLDKIVWEVDRWSCKAYEGFFKNKPTQLAQIVQMFSVSAIFRRVKGGSIAREEINALRKELHDRADSLSARIITPIHFSVSKKGRLLECMIADPHFGRHAWGRELNGEDFDLAIADKVYRELVTVLIQESAYQPYEKVLFVLGNDFFNSDNTAGTTFAGTPQDNDGRHRKVWQVGKKAAIWAIEQFAQIAPVHVLSIPGNHDTESVYYLSDSIETYFRNTQHVEVDNGESSRKYIRYSNTLIGFSHGDKIKASEYPAIMSNERAKDFGEVRFREWHKAHIHTDRVELGEYHGFKVRTVPSPTATDLWHYENGYIGNLRSGVVYIYDREDGYKGEHFHTVCPDPKTITLKTSLLL